MSAATTLGVLAVLGGSAAPASALVVRTPVELVSYSSVSEYGDADSTDTAVSDGMQEVAFISSASNLDAPTNGEAQVYVRDRATGALELISVDSMGAPAAGDSTSVAMSADGRFVAFTSAGPEIVSGVSTANAQAYLRDRDTGSTILLSADRAGVPASSEVRFVDMDASGSTVAFETAAQLFGVPSNGVAQVYVWRNGTIDMASADLSGSFGTTTGAFKPRVSPDGRTVGFTSDDIRLASFPRPNGKLEAWVFDVATGYVQMVSTSEDTSQPGDQNSTLVDLLDGGRVLISSAAQNLTTGLTLNPFVSQVFLVEGANPTSTTRSYRLVSHTVDSSTTGAGSDSYEAFAPDDGSYVVFASVATDLVAAPLGGNVDAFTWNATTGAVIAESLDVFDLTRLSGRIELDGVAHDGAGFGFSGESLVLTQTPGPVPLARQAYVGFPSSIADDPAPAPGTGQGASTTGGSRAALAHTGAEVAAWSVWAVASAAALLAGAGAVAVIARRRRRA